ncbi:MAG: ribonuclease III [Gammaproteobacteria bacterium]|nr:ribonuclease III [Gammaproteobacteria bacterium]
MDQSQHLLVLANRLEYTFENIELLNEALTHRSVSSNNNERFEFLGDSILNFVIADVLFQQRPDLREGDLSRLRASLVNGETLAEIARDMNLGDCINLGAGELKSGGFRRASILADTVESILGAVYCDSDFDTCRALILRLFESRLSNLPDLDSLKDPKTRLQELLQSRRLSVPFYEVVGVSGKAHAQVFKVRCSIEEIDCVTQAEGGSRRKAEQHAAEAAYEQVKNKLNV